MRFLRADSEQLLGHRDELDSSCRQIEQSGEELRSELKQVAHAWTGVAADAFQDRVSAAQRTLDMLLDDLVALRDTLAGAAENYRSAEEANHEMWSGV